MLRQIALTQSSMQCFMFNVWLNIQVCSIETGCHWLSTSAKQDRVLYTIEKHTKKDTETMARSRIAWGQKLRALFAIFLAKPSDYSWVRSGRNGWRATPWWSSETWRRGTAVRWRRLGWWRRFRLLSIGSPFWFTCKRKMNLFGDVVWVLRYRLPNSNVLLLVVHSLSNSIQPCPTSLQVLANSKWGIEGNWRVLLGTRQRIPHIKSPISTS